MGGKKGRKRGSWPLRQRAPTLPRLWHTVHGYPPYAMSGGRDGSPSSEALLGEMRRCSLLLPPTPTKMDYAQMQAFSRLLPELPRPALVADRDRRIAKPSVSMGYVYGASRIPQPVVTPPASPVRSAPITPHRHRGRQQSSDSTLSDILRSTEKRLREGSVSETIRSRRTTTSPTRTTPGQLLDPREYGVAGSRSRTPSPQKGVSSRPFTPSYERHDSQQSASSGTDSLAGEEFPATDVPSGLTSPSRKQKKTEAEVLLPQEQSRRSSQASELSTLYSEDEMPEEVKRAIMPLPGLVVQPQPAAHVRPPTMNDPFMMALPPLSFPRASSIGTWPSKTSKSQELLRQSVQRSQRLRSLTVGHARAQSQGLTLAPGPVVHPPKPSVLPVLPHTRAVSVTIPRSIQPYMPSRASEPPPSPARQSPTTQSPTGPLFLRVTRTSTLSTIPLLPPPSAPGLEILRDAKHDKPASPTKSTPTPSNQPQQHQQSQALRSPILPLPSTERPPSPTHHVGGELRLSLILPPKALLQDRSSATSSLYSQTPTPTATQPAAAAAAAAIELNRAGFQANSSLYPAPLSARPTSRAPARSRLSAELADHNNSDGEEGGNRSRDEDDDDNEEEEEDGDTPLAVTSTIASLRRMNSGVSTASSLRSVADRGSIASGGGVSPSPDKAGSVVAAGRESPAERAQRKSIGARNYFVMGGGAQARRVSRVGSGVHGGAVKSPTGGGVGGVSGDGNGSGTGSPHKRRRPGSMHPQRRSSAMSGVACPDFTGGGEEGKENNAGGFKIGAGEFTFEVSNPNAGSGKGGLGLQEGSSGSVNALVMPQKDSQRLSLAWKPAEGGVSRTGSPVRFGGSPSRATIRSVDSPGLYDRQGFLISGSPVRGVSPAGLRV